MRDFRGEGLDSGPFPGLLTPVAFLGYSIFALLLKQNIHMFVSLPLEGFFFFFFFFFFGEWSGKCIFPKILSRGKE